MLAPWDAFALRTFRDAYFVWPALIAALAGYAMVARREFWRDPAFFLVFAGFSFFFFYKIHVVPEQFWMARRFLPMILPGALLLASGALFGPSTPEHRRTVRRGVGGRRVHVVHRLAVRRRRQAGRRASWNTRAPSGRSISSRSISRTRDLVLVESRNASDLHVLAVPLADVYGLQVLVLESQVPDRAAVRSVPGATR